jgi:hypothetical protein
MDPQFLRLRERLLPRIVLQESLRRGSQVPLRIQLEKAGRPAKKLLLHGRMHLVLQTLTFISSSQYILTICSLSCDNLTKNLSYRCRGLWYSGLPTFSEGHYVDVGSYALKRSFVFFWQRIGAGFHIRYTFILCAGRITGTTGHIIYG